MYVREYIIIINICLEYYIGSIKFIVLIRFYIQFRTSYNTKSDEYVLL